MISGFPSHRLRFPFLKICLFMLAVLIPVSGCDKKDKPLTIADLNGDECLYVERMVVLERAKTAALLDRANGDALLDSLAAAWGDSSRQETLKGAPKDPIRAEAVTDLLRRVLVAEQDSLMTSTGQERLHLPLPEPAPVPEPAPIETPPES
jgi:hypothetical protein